MGLLPQFRSPLMWDVFAVSTYATVSALFWFIGLIPDFATLRDRATNRLVKILYGMLAMGWRGSAFHWQRYESAYLLLAGLSGGAPALTLSVQTDAASRWMAVETYVAQQAQIASRALRALDEADCLPIDVFATISPGDAGDRIPPEPRCSGIAHR